MLNILVVGESVTLAHQARAMVVAEWLAAQTHCKVTLAETCPLSAQATFLPGPARVQIPGISPARFKQALAAGRPVYSAVDIQSYIQDDLALFEQVRPDLVIGDFRLSLSSSARMAGVRYATITNAYWCPTSQAGYPMPVLPWTGLLPLWLEESLFGLGLWLAMPAHCRAVNAARSAASLGSLGHDLRRVYTDADTVLIADPPGLFELGRLPSTHHFLGPILWAPKVDLPVWWNEVPVTGPVAYVALGSSGPHDALGQVLQALTGAGWFALAASAGAENSTLHLPNARLASFLPGDQAAAKADVVICNGGSMGCQQALVANRPVLGIASNMDQFMNMAGIVASGAGICLRADRLTPERIRLACERLLLEPSFKSAAARLGALMRETDAQSNLLALLPGLIASK